MSVRAFDLANRVAIVTGGASGIGVGITTVLAEAGATVVIADNNAEAACREAAVLNQAGMRAGVVEVDLADEVSIVKACAQVCSEYGTPCRAIQCRNTAKAGPQFSSSALNSRSLCNPFRLS